MYSSLNISSVIKLRRISRAGHVNPMEGWRNTCRNLVGNLQER
jgi:hypothetical protein